MAPPLWKLLLAVQVSSGQKSQTCEDQTSLLQSHSSNKKSALGLIAEETHQLNFPKISSLTDPKQRKMALAQFEETAAELAANRAAVTPVVVEVCNSTSELLRDMVMPAIIREHDTDVAMLDATYAEFDRIEEQRLEYEQLILNSLDSVYGPEGLIEVHTQCRIRESDECVRCSQCEDSCEEHITTCELAEVELRTRLEEVIETVSRDAYCDENHQIQPPHTETVITQTMHHTNLPAFNAYLAALAAFEECEETRDVVCEECEEESATVESLLAINHERHLSEDGWSIRPTSENQVCRNHTDVRMQCNTIQRQLQAAACDARHLAINYLNLYEAAFLAAVTRYNNQKATVMILEADRKVEWDTLERVICLLMSLTNEEDGSASSVATAELIEGCRNDYVDTSHLDIVYRPTPEMGNLPPLPHNPCDDEFADEAYGDLPECMGIPEYQERHDHGVLTDCTCSAEAPPEVHTGFPYELGPYLLFNAGFELNSAAGFQIEFAGMDAEWAVATGGTQYVGSLSPFVAVTLPDLDNAFGLTGTDSVADVAWAYGDPQGTTDMVLHGEDYPETIQHRFVRTGGFVYRNAQGLVVALKEIAPSSDSLGQVAQLSLFFGEPLEIAESLALQACPTLSPITFGRLQDSGAEAYCWEFSGVIPHCEHGCFVFRTADHGFIAFPVGEGPLGDEENLGN